MVVVVVFHGGWSGCEEAEVSVCFLVGFAFGLYNPKVFFLYK